MKARYVHTNLVASNWQELAAFYVDVFGCVPVPPERHLSGEWLDRATALPNAHIDGVHLRLPGAGEHGPTLEVFQYSEEVSGGVSAANRSGYGHVAFEVEDVATTAEIIALHGGGLLGEVVTREIPGVGTLTFAYALDPEDNVVEIQSWKQPPP
jgi:catechol 2,3-dioxygenase-like lactoylglutathione lyase family enzyme